MQKKYCLADIIYTFQKKKWVHSQEKNKTLLLISIFCNKWITYSKREFNCFANSPGIICFRSIFLLQFIQLISNKAQIGTSTYMTSSSYQILNFSYAKRLKVSKMYLLYNATVLPFLAPSLNNVIVFHPVDTCSKISGIWSYAFVVQLKPANLFLAGCQ